METTIQFFKDALRNEVKATAWYKMAAESTHNDENRMLFLELASVEEDHARILVAKAKNAPWGPSFEPERYLNELEANTKTAISVEEADLIENGSMSQILETAITWEKQARDTYAKLAETTMDPEMKNYYQELSHEEQTHANSLTTLLTSLDMNPEDRPGL